MHTKNTKQMHLEIINFSENFPVTTILTSTLQMIFERVFI